MANDLSDPPAPAPNCVNCAWREVCQKRFGQAPDYARHCVDYTYDVRLRTKKDNNDSTDSRDN